MALKASDAEFILVIPMVGVRPEQLNFIVEKILIIGYSFNMLKTNVIEIRKLMLSMSITSAEIARECNVCRSYISHVVSGRAKSERIRQKIASKLGKSIDELWPTL